MNLHVDTAALTLTADGVSTPCIIGRTGAIAAADKREGDGRTPRGRFALREVLLRPDRGLAVPATALPWRWLAPADGWSDDPTDPAYNTAVRHPHPFSAEHLWRDDGLYDVLIPLGYNDVAPVAGRGSAIFLHCTDAGQPVTAGCVAVQRDALLALLPWLRPNDWIEIV